MPEKIETDLSLATRGRFEVIFGPIGLKLGSIGLRGTGRTCEGSKSAQPNKKAVKKVKKEFFRRPGLELVLGGTLA